MCIREEWFVAFDNLCYSLFFETILLTKWFSKCWRFLWSSLWKRFYYDGGSSWQIYYKINVFSNSIASHRFSRVIHSKAFTWSSLEDFMSIKSLCAPNNFHLNCQTQRINFVYSFVFLTRQSNITWTGVDKLWRYTFEQTRVIFTDQIKDKFLLQYFISLNELYLV